MFKKNSIERWKNLTCYLNCFSKFNDVFAVFASEAFQHGGRRGNRALQVLRQEFTVLSDIIESGPRTQCVARLRNRSVEQACTNTRAKRERKVSSLFFKTTVIIGGHLMLAYDFVYRPLLSHSMTFSLPLERGDNRWRCTLPPPELWPKSVMLSESPPKCWMLDLIHLRAMTWSNRP